MFQCAHARRDLRDRSLPRLRPLPGPGGAQGRPPLANALFDVADPVAHAAARAFSRARATMLTAQADIGEGADVEQLLDRLQSESDAHEPALAALLAIRFYPQRICRAIPDR
jgi:hypothetical protein